MPNCFSASSCCAGEGIGKALADATAAAMANSLAFFDMDGASKQRVVACNGRSIPARSHKRETGFLWEPCATLPAEKLMPDRALTFGRYRLEPPAGLMSGARA